MNDLLLWRALGEPKPLADEVVPLLEELASRPPGVRMPFVGRLIRAARDERPRVRAAALAGLAGHDGPEAIRAVVRGLDDPRSSPIPGRSGRSWLISGNRSNHRPSRRLLGSLLCVKTERVVIDVTIAE